MRNLKIINTLVLLFVFTLCAQAQKNFAKDADAAFRNEAYYEAKDLYKKAYPKVPKAEEKARIIFQIAETYRLMTDASQAEVWYMKAIGKGYGEHHVGVYVRLGDIQRKLGKYNLAIRSYKKYIDLNEDHLVAKRKLKKCELLKEASPLGKGAKHTMRIQVLDSRTSRPIKGARIKVVGTDNSSYEVTTDDNGGFNFELNGDRIPINDPSANRYIKANVVYSLQVDKTGFLVAKDQISTIGLKESTTFIKEFYIQYAGVKSNIALPQVEFTEDNSLRFARATPSDINMGLAGGSSTMDGLYNTLIENPTISIELQAHTDHRGGATYNLTSSQEQAQACLDYLVKRGISKDRLTAKGYGGANPLSGCSKEEIAQLETKIEKEEAHKKNRRTEFIVLSFD